jgi:hypothetical protein
LSTLDGSFIRTRGTSRQSTVHLGTWREPGGRRARWLARVPKRLAGPALVAILVSLSPVAAAAKTLTLSAESGEFNASTLGAAASSTAIAGSFRIVSFSGTRAWPPAAYMGVHQGPNRNNSVQVLAIRNREADDVLVLGYRLVVDGKEAKVASLESVPLAATVRVSVVFKDGVAVIRVNGGKPVELQTPFREVAPYVSVSSGRAEFVIDA